jgi:hypothetical protein
MMLYSLYSESTYHSAHVFACWGGVIDKNMIDMQVTPAGDYLFLIIHQNWSL